MKNILEITGRVIGTEKVNSVSARELHSILEVKKAFTTWIKVALDNAGAIEEEDFKKLKYSLEGSGYKIDYILTTDMAKHISMMSKVKKSKEIRDYFIQFEKKAKNVIQSQSQQIQLMQETLHQLAITDERVTKIESNMRIENWQQKRLEDVKNKKVYELVEKHDFANDKTMIKKLHSRVWKALKKRFNIPRYNELAICEFENGVNFIQKLNLADII